MSGSQTPAETSAECATARLGLTEQLLHTRYTFDSRQMSARNVLHY